jgi:undecaprenyl-diphosphatase
MTFLQAVIIAIVEGITEYLPVSSTGHMIIASSFMGIAGDDFTKMFTVAIQFGAILSVVLLYWKRFFQSVDFYYKLIAGFIPAAILGKLLNDFIDSLLENVTVVAITLVLGGIVLLFIDRWIKAEGNAENDRLDLPKAFKIGLFQCIAMIPGVSRSAATIIGGMTQGLSRKTAAEFSFFLAVPTMFAATVYKIYKYTKNVSFSGDQLQLLLVGNVVAFIVALIAVKTFISFLTKHGFKVFGYYRIILGIALLLLSAFGIQLTIV